MDTISYKYTEIAERIKHKILQGIYPPQTPIPPENTLAEEYSVSRITIRNALQTLIEEGYLYSIPGKGNYVLRKINDKFSVSLKPEDLLNTTYDHIELLGSEIIKPTIDLVYHLRIAPDTRIIQINWRLLKEDIPLLLDTQFIPYFPGMTLWNDHVEYTTFSKIVSQKNNIFNTSETIQFQAVPCDVSTAELLKISSGSPVMTITQKVYDNDEPLAMRKLYVHSSYCQISGLSYMH